jgi:hypothetical protein
MSNTLGRPSLSHTLRKKVTWARNSFASKEPGPHKSSHWSAKWLNASAMFPRSFGCDIRIPAKNLQLAMATTIHNRNLALKIGDLIPTRIKNH